MKYVRVLVGIMMILKITEPIFGLFLDEGKRQEIKNTVDTLKKAVEESRGELQIEDNYEDIYQGIGEEVKKRLEKCGGGYEIVSVDFSREGDEEKVIIAVSEKRETKEGNIWIAPITLGEEKGDNTAEEERLKELYGGCLGMDAGKIEILLQ